MNYKEFVNSRISAAIESCISQQTRVFGERKEIKDYFLKKVYISKEKPFISGSILSNSFIGVYIAFGREILGLKDKSIFYTDSEGCAVLKTTNLAFGLLESSESLAEDRYLVEHNNEFGATFSLAQKGEERIEKILSEEVLLGTSLEKRIPKPVKRLIKDSDTFRREPAPTFAEYKEDVKNFQFSNLVSEFDINKKFSLAFEIRRIKENRKYNNFKKKVKQKTKEAYDWFWDTDGMQFCEKPDFFKNGKMINESIIFSLYGDDLNEKQIADELKIKEKNSKKCLGFLIDNNFINCTDNIYSLSEKGKDFVNCIVSFFDKL